MMNLEKPPWWAGTPSSRAARPGLSVTLENWSLSMGWFPAIIATTLSLEVTMSTRRIPKGPGRRPKSLARRRCMELLAQGWSLNAACREVGVVRTTGHNRLIPELEKLGHHAVTVDLPVDDLTVGLQGYTDVATEAVAHVPGPLLAVGHSNARSTVLGLEKTLELEGIVLLTAVVALSPEVAADQPASPMLDEVYSEFTIDEHGFAHMSEDFCRRRS